MSTLLGLQIAMLPKSRRTFSASIQAIETDKKSPFHYDITFGKDNHFSLLKDGLTPDYKTLIGKRVEVYMGAGNEICKILLTSTSQPVYKSANMIEQIQLCIDSEEYKKERIQKIMSDPNQQLHYEKVKQSIPFYRKVHFPKVENIGPSPFRFDQIVQLALIESIQAAAEKYSPVYEIDHAQELRNFYCHYFFLAQLDTTAPVISYEEFIEFVKESLGCNDLDENEEKTQDEKDMYEFFEDVSYYLEYESSWWLEKWRKAVVSTTYNESREHMKKIPEKWREVAQMPCPVPPYTIEETVTICYMYSMRKAYSYIRNSNRSEIPSRDSYLVNLYYAYCKYAKYSTAEHAKKFYLPYTDFLDDINWIIQTMQE